MEDYKAKYEEALGWMKEVYPTLQGAAKEDAEHFFPELKESDDDRMKKLCISVVKQFAAVCRKEDKYLPEVEKCIAWIEKQGEQKFIDKIQLGKKYKCIASPRYSTFVRGFIYKPEDKFLCSLMNFCSDCFEPIEDGEQKPADKVEPKFKVKYAGSKYNVFETKDIAGITYYGIEDESNHIDYVLPDNCEIVSEQKPAWSEEDDNMIMSIIHHLDSHKNYVTNTTNIEQCQNWLKSLKDRVQPKQEWSEEDEETLKDIITSMTNLKDSAMSDALRDIYNSKIDWLKSIRPQKPIEWTMQDEEELQIALDTLVKAGQHSSAKWLKNVCLVPQNRWEPSEEMLEALYRVIPENVMEKSEDDMLLDKLYQGLKYGKVLSEN